MTDWTSTDDTLDVAIVGMAARFPGAEDVDRLWANLVAGVESITRLAPDEIEPWLFGLSFRDSPQLVPVAAEIADAECFDAELFGMTPQEAVLTDPQQRVFLECAWAALEHAGCDPDRAGVPIGVFAGASFNTHLLRLVENPAAVGVFDPLASILANDKDHLTTRCAYELGLRGPTVTVQTACSSSLVAVHLACQSLLAYGCDVALAGGVSVKLPQRTGYVWQAGGIQSPDGHCRAFDRAAAGCVFGNGVGVVVLKRLRDALAAGDRVHAVVKGSAINNDGADKAGYTAPSERGQAEVIVAALSAAGVEPAAIGYVEAHGTGTLLGDAIEVAALRRAFGDPAGRARPCALGSIKTNIGHADAASGIAGLVKAALVVEHGQIPPSLHFEAAAEELGLDGSGFAVNAALRAWDDPGPRRAGVSSFGMGGANAHVVLEEAPPERAGEPCRHRAQVVCLSASDPAALLRQRRALAERLARDPGLDLGDVAWTLQVGRRRLGRRLALVARDTAEACRLLHDGGDAGRAARDASPRALHGGDASAGEPQVVLVVGEPGAGGGAPPGVRGERAVHAAVARGDDRAVQAAVARVQALVQRLVALGVKPVAVVAGEGGAVVAESLTRGPTPLLPPDLPLLALATGLPIAAAHDHGTTAADDTTRATAGARLAATLALARPLVLAVGAGAATGAEVARLLATTAIAAGDDGDDDVPLDAIAALWAAGCDVDWHALHGGERHRKVALPTYPFARQVFEPTRQAERARPVLATAAVAPRDAVERELAGIWERLLGLTGLGVHDDFYELGGDSLQATNLLLEVQRALGLEIPLRGFVDDPTIAGMAQWARSVAAEAGAEHVPPHEERRGMRIGVTVDELAADVVLDAALVPPAGALPAEPERVFLTGATGFLGSHLVRALVDDTTAEIVCLVRAPGDAEAAARLERTLAERGLSCAAVAGRVRALAGDLAAPRLGLDPATWQRLADEVDLVLHNGAEVNFVRSYRSLRNVNVGGTQRVLALAAAGRAKAVHHVSTMAVFAPFASAALQEPVREDAELHHDGVFLDGYAQSKWVAEGVARLARARGFAVAVHRPGWVAGDSRSGACPSDDFVYALIRGCVEIGAAPDVEFLLEMAPVDYVARAIVHVARRRDSSGRTFHLTQGERTPWSRLVGWLAAAGYPLEVEPYRVWRSRLLASAARDRRGALYRLLTVFPDLPDDASVGAALARAMSLPATSADGTHAALAGSGITCPPLDATLFARYLEFLERTGLLERGPSPDGARAAAP